MRIIKKLSKLLYLLFLLILALVIDLLIFAATANCAGCSGFGQFLTSASSLTGPVLVSLIALFPHLTKVIKGRYNKS